MAALRRVLPEPLDDLVIHHGAFVAGITDIAVSWWEGRIDAWGVFDSLIGFRHGFREVDGLTCRYGRRTPVLRRLLSTR
ncbi:hypothetical protein ACFVUY_39510 [Kitasatospora sp. NPDC058063]|uniref:hypothetical protein n=1 Tax=unclassified Kitasatospora TaxID=2633591 RepID=UPI0036DA0CA3